MAGWFFPGRGRAGRIGGGPRRPSPLNRGKTKGSPAQAGSCLGHGWPSSSHIRPVSYRVFKGCTKCMPVKSGSIVRGSPKCRRSPSAALRGLWVFPCPKPWIRRLACCPPCFLRVLSALLVKTIQNAKPVPLVSSPPQFLPACPGAFRGPYGLLSGFSAVHFLPA
jgi:hypothetical protein